MESVEINADLRQKIGAALAKTRYFGKLTAEQVDKVVQLAEVQRCEPDDVLVRQGEEADGFFLILSGRAAVRVAKGDGDAMVEVGRIGPPSTFGEVGLLLRRQRTATVVAAEAMLALRFSSAAFRSMMKRIQPFALGIAQGLADRLDKVSAQIPLPQGDDAAPAPEALALLPVPFMQRHRLLALAKEEGVVTLGVVGDPGPEALAGVRQLLPGAELDLVRISEARFGEVLRRHGGLAAWQAGAEPAAAGDAEAVRSPKLDGMLERAVAEGASDLHLSAGAKPHWRIDGDLHEIADSAEVGREEAWQLLRPVMAERHVARFEEGQDVDFAYELSGTARFRVNLYRDRHGACAVLRQIPFEIQSLDQLGLPQVLKRLCGLPKGLVLVTGPSGSGKSTTLAAMVDLINRTRPVHIVTLEDPIEFIHPKHLALVNQREVGQHAASFGGALRTVVRADPDVVLVGEMRDLETVAMALETALTGHLVFATLHTSSAVSTIDRVIDLFPGDQQEKARSTLADSLKGVVCQTLLKRRDGGRVPAAEVLVVDYPAASLVREGKHHQIPTYMQTNQGKGNTLLNDDLKRLVDERKVTYDEALDKALDKTELAKRLGRKKA